MDNKQIDLEVIFVVICFVYFNHQGVKMILFWEVISLPLKSDFLMVLMYAL